MYHLYTAGTANGRRPAVMLEECGLPYVVHKVDLAKGDNKKPDFLKLNPQGAIPVLVEGEGEKRQVLSQSGAILLHLAEKTGKFLPKDPAERATALQWFMMVQTDVAPASSAIFHNSMAVPEKSEANIKFFTDRFLGLLKTVDGRLKENKFVGGESPSIADFALITVVAARQDAIDKAPGLDAVKRWAREMKARPGIAKALEVAA
jgi:GST-like protein